MGLKLSCIHRGSLSRQVHQQASPAPARVIAADGSLKELPASSSSRVSDVLGHTGDAAQSLFVCNSDALYFNEHPPALAPADLLRPGQIYFVLPAAMLEKPLSTADMAALAVRASTALASSTKRRSHGRRRARGKKKAVRVMPVREEMAHGGDGEDVFFNEKLNQQTLGEFGVSLNPAMRDEKKLAAAAATSRLKRALSIIQEDAE
ncbi:uncharacterized protein LOC120654944 [Panicum virgatum]|uniref:Uncharacterized protein n=1 Tax=Panicum virgatum TaxID=38727 RepID=A0A8T0X0X4_PANVG|nr:uncharacterized protein LOC120654944 [Panicum virgatum]KAG2649149.1 hypothetical protein PVAP13_1NG055800 [Panicum virgatum]